MSDNGEPAADGWDCKHGLPKGEGCLVCALQQLTSVGRRRAATEAKAADLREQTDALILKGYRAGASKQALARAAGLTRQTVYGVLLRAGVKT